MFVQVSGDNNGINDDTVLDGKWTTQAITLILFQRGQFGPASKLQVHADQQRGNAHLNQCFCANLSDSTVHMESVQLLLFSGKTRDEWFKCNERLHSEACIMDLTWALISVKNLGSN